MLISCRISKIHPAISANCKCHNVKSNNEDDLEKVNQPRATSKAWITRVKPLCTS